MTLLEGEIREVGIEVCSQLDEDFIIEAAEYYIQKYDGTEIEQGFATIRGHKLITLMNAKEKGRYHIVFKYHIGSEILKAKFYCEVV